LKAYLGCMENEVILSIWFAQSSPCMHCRMDFWNPFWVWFLKVVLVNSKNILYLCLYYIVSLFTN
jgi:hypothetical protein